MFFAALAGCSATPAAAPSPAAAPFPTDASAGIFTAAQADQGEQTFNRHCSTCHARNQFTGQMFEITWMAESVGGLYQFIRTAMPQNDPGSLEPEEYAAIVAYFLRMNGRPPGERPLPADGDVLAGVRW